MSLKKIVGSVVFGGALSLVLYVGGCGSSSPGGGAGSGGSTGSGSGGSTGSGTGGSTGSGTGGSHGSGSGGSSGISPFPDGGGDSGGGTCPASVAKYTPMTYTTAVANQGLCMPADITAFNAACGDAGTDTLCSAWFTANVMGAMDGGGAGTTCGNCIVTPTNNGGAWVDPYGVVEPNYAACIQLSDSTNGATCAPAYDAASGCIGFACDQCSSMTTFDGCEDTVTGKAGACASEISTANTACATDFADGGADGNNGVCSPGAATMTVDPDFTYIITLICGTAG